MRFSSLLPALLISVSIPAIVAAATYNEPAHSEPLVMNDWHVAPMLASNSADPSYCAMATHYAAGPVVTFTRNSEDKGSIAIDFPGAALEKGKKYAVTLTIGRKSRTYHANSIGNTQVVLQTGINKSLDDALASGEPLTISLDGTPGLYTLEGNPRAFFEFDHCLKALKSGATANVAKAQPTAPAFAPVNSVAQTPTTAAKTAPSQAVIFDQVPAQAAAPKTAAPIQQEPLKQLSSPASAPAPASTTALSPTDLAKPMTAVTPSAPKDAAPDVLWDKAPSKPVAAPPSSANAPVVAPALLPEPVAKPKQDLMVEKLANTVPANGTEIKPLDTKEKLKSSLAKAREEAAEEEVLVDAKPAVKEPVVPEKKVAAPKPEPIKPVVTEAPKPVTAKAVAPVVTPAPIVATEDVAPKRIPLAHMSETPSIQNLIFDDGVAPTSVKETPAVQHQEEFVPVPAVLQKEKTITPPKQLDVQNEIKSVAPVPAPVAAPAPVIAEAPAPAPVIAAAPIAPVAMPAPAAMPPQVKKQETVLPPVAKELNTVMPSTGHPTVEPMQRYQKLDMVRTPPVIATVHPTRSVTFRPAPAAATGSWSTRTINASGNGKNDGFCLIENHFNNDSTLMIGQRADGLSTVGINYGIDMLQADKDYTATVQVDGDFEEDFRGYAENPKTLIVQMGKKQSFFDALSHAQAVHIAMPGVASTFALEGLPAGLNEFSNCVTAMGGAPLYTNTAPVAPVVPVEQVETVTLETPVAPIATAPVAPIVAAAPIAPVTAPAVTSIAPAPVIAEAPQPAPVAAPPVLPAPVIAAPSIEPAPAPVVAAAPVVPAPVAVAVAAPAPTPAPTPGRVIVASKAIFENKPAPVDKAPVAVAEPAVAPVAAEPAPAPVVAQKPATDILWEKQTATASPVVPVLSSPATPQENMGWATDVRTLLSQASIFGATVDDTSASWSNKGVTGHVSSFGKKDILDAASDAVDKAEKACGKDGVFDSQVGVPDTYGDITVQPMETKCIAEDGRVFVSAWIMLQNAYGTSAWQIESLIEQKPIAFALRKKLLGVLQSTTDTATTSLTDYNS